MRSDSGTLPDALAAQHSAPSTQTSGGKSKARGRGRSKQNTYSSNPDLQEAKLEKKTKPNPSTSHMIGALR